MTPTLLAFLGGVGLDAAVGEPPTRFHPVAWLGRAIDRVDRPWGRPRLAGLLVASFGPLVVAGVVALGVWLVGQGTPALATVVGVFVVFLTTSCRHLLGTVRSVGHRTGSDLAAARESLLALAGRDAADLSPGEVRSGALESLAENYVDGLVAPVTWFVAGAGLTTVVGGTDVAVLAGACGGAVWLKSVNTLDSMLGYPSKPWGTASARLDDAAMWLPARLGAGLLALALASPGALRLAKRWSAGVSSPNAGWPMGVLAAGLDVRFVKPGHYELNPDASLPTEFHVDRAVRRVALAALLAFGVAGLALRLGLG